MWSAAEKTRGICQTDKSVQIAKLRTLLSAGGLHFIMGLRQSAASDRDLDLGPIAARGGERPVAHETGKTRSQLVAELKELRSRVLELELEKAEPAPPQRKEQARHRPPDPDHLYRTAPVGMCVLDTDLRFVRVNERLAAISGRPVSEHLGRTLRQVIPDLAAKMEPICRRVIESGKPLYDMEIRGVTPEPELVGVKYGV